MNLDFHEAVARAVAAFDSLTPSQKLRHRYMQRRSLARGMGSSSTPHDVHCANVDKRMPHESTLTDTQIGLILGRRASRMKRVATALIWLAMFLWLGLMLGAALAQEPAPEHHGHTHQGAAGQFYQTWMMPDAPHVSCCHNEDCAPAQSRWSGDHWEARWSDASDWVPIPANKVEQNRDTPDGRSHMCGRTNRLGPGFNVFCFVRGGGA